MTVRKHRGINQFGGKIGKLKKGYKYSGKTLKNGKPEIIKIKKRKVIKKVQKGGFLVKVTEEDFYNYLKDKFSDIESESLHISVFKYLRSVFEGNSQENVRKLFNDTLHSDLFANPQGTAIERFIGPDKVVPEIFLRLLTEFMNKLHGSINIYDPENTGSLFKYKENIEGITHEGLKNLISKINNLFKDKSKKQIQSLYFEGKEVVDSVKLGEQQQREKNKLKKEYYEKIQKYIKAGKLYFVTAIDLNDLDNVAAYKENFMTNGIHTYIENPQKFFTPWKKEDIHL